jgi:hypothetical protein
MKKIFVLFLLIVAVFSCSKNDDNRNGNILIKGDLSGTTKGLGVSKGPSLSDAAKVVVFTGERYTVTDIVNGAFSTDAPMGSATALIFVDENNRYIGNLSVSGLNILPLVSLSDGENTVIDLSSLTLLGTSVIPSNNPIGTEILINNEDIEVLREIGSYYDAIAQNLDADDDGVLDIFGGKEIVVSSEFEVNSGKFGLNSVPAMVTDSSQMSIGYTVRIRGGKVLYPSSPAPSFTGPAGNPHSDIVGKGYGLDNTCDCWRAGFMRQPQGQYSGPLSLPFGKGEYTFTLDGIDKKTLHYASIRATQFLLLAVPVIKTDAQGIIKNVEIEYRRPGGAKVDYSKYITTLSLMLKKSASQVIHQEGSFFNLMDKLPDFENVAISKQINISELDQLIVNYTDLVGNLYTIIWVKQ